MQPSMADGRHHQLGQICYVPLYIVPQGTAGGPSVDMASLQSCAAAMAAAGGASAQGFSPFLVQLPAPSAPASSSSSAPSSPGTSSSSPASPGQSHAHQRHQAQLAQLAQHYAALQHQEQQRTPAPAAGLAEYRLANFASLLPSGGGSAPQTQQTQQTQQQQPVQLPSPFVMPSLAALPHLAAAAAAAGAQQTHFPFPFQLQSSGALYTGPPPSVAAEASATSTCTTSSSDPATTGSSCTVSGKKEIKFKYHMSIMPQLATNAGAPAPPKVEMKKKRKPRMRITGRVCTHCGATKTTEWRMGPEGRGTLCNACGLRYRKKLLMDGQKDPNAKITMSMLLNATKKTTKPGSSSAKDEGPSSSPTRRSDDESP